MTQTDEERRAKRLEYQRQYYAKRRATDADFIEKRNEASRKYYHAHKEKVRQDKVARIMRLAKRDDADGIYKVIWGNK